MDFVSTDKDRVNDPGLAQITFKLIILSVHIANRCICDQEAIVECLITSVKGFLTSSYHSILIVTELFLFWPEPLV